MATPQAMTGKQKKAAAQAAATKAGKDGEGKAKKPAREIIIPEIKKGALSTDVGPRVIAALARVNQDEEKAQDILRAVDAKRYDLLAQTTQAIVKAAKADNTIDLAATVDTGQDAAKRMAALNDQLGIVLGTREVVIVGKGDKTVRKMAWAKSVASFFPMPGENKETDQYRAKNTLRGNYVTMQKKCAMAALAIVENDIKTKMDTKTGTLLLAGPVVKKNFGSDEVRLDEKQTVKKGKTEIKLTQKPSFTAVADIAATSHGKKLDRTRAASGSSSVQDPVKVLEGLAKAVITACERFKGKAGPNDAEIAALEKIYNAVDAVLS